MKVEIDSKSGFCAGVIRAIRSAEDYLSENGGTPLYSLGDIVHNESELKRLEGLGLRTVSYDRLGSLRGTGAKVLIRAHGEPPATYATADEYGLGLIDCTCPVVLRLQESIREAQERLEKTGGTLIIFGKEGHPEVLGLLGQVDKIVPVLVHSAEDLREKLSSGLIDPSRPAEIFSQTTMDTGDYASVCDTLREVFGNALSVHDTICRQVASRRTALESFAAAHDVIVFVSGKNSSNGRVLSDACRGINPRTYVVGACSDIRSEWFGANDTVGVCGATSTPGWLLESVAGYIEKICYICAKN